MSKVKDVVLEGAMYVGSLLLIISSGALIAIIVIAPFVLPVVCVWAIIKLVNHYIGAAP